MLAPLQAASERGLAVSLVAPMPDGVIDSAAIEAALRPDTRLISVMAVNNEIGTVQPVTEIAAIAGERGIAFHVDASQAIGKLDLDWGDLDFVSVSAHKLYGPVGIGALYVGPRAPALAALILGGGQQHGLRSGTLPVAQIAGFGAACDVAAQRRKEDGERIAGLAARLWSQLERTGGVSRNGSATQAVPGCLDFAIEGLLADALLAAVPGVAISSGSACSSASGGGSHVLRALGFSAARRSSSLRIGLGRYTTGAEVETAGGLLLSAIGQLREVWAAGSAAA